MSDILKEAQEAFAECEAKETDNRKNFEADVRFARLEEQWPDDEYQSRFGDDPRLTINKLAPVIRQVVNDATQNRPAITVRPQDSGADPETAEIMSGLIRNIEQSSDADVAYDTAVDNAVSGGFGYFRINLRYGCDDSWDQDIVIDRVINPLSIYSDPHSTTADSSDWNLAFVTDQMTKKAFERKYKNEAQVDWASHDFPQNWIEEDQITVAEYWTRTEVKKRLVRLIGPGGEEIVLTADEMAERAEELYERGFTVGQEKEVKSYEVKQRILTGVEVIDETAWAGKFIPIVPVYGDEVVLKNKRYFRSLIRSAIDAQRMYNYWASKTTALVALAPRVPFTGEQGAFDVDENWDKVNDESIPYLEYAKGTERPKREPFAGVPSGMMQEMMNAAEHIKAVTGIYDASLGARSNETSGVAIRNRQMEGDVSTFHFIDNLTRAIRHGGRILIDLIPKVYDSERVIRVLGNDNNVNTVPLKQPTPTLKNGKPVLDQAGQPIMRIYDLTAGKYDLAVEAGPSYTTRREETRAELVEIMRAVPESAVILGPMYLRQSDWPGADEAADKMEGKDQNGPQIPPEVQQQMQEGMQLIQQLQQENATLKAGEQSKIAEAAMRQREMQINAEGAADDRRLKMMELQIKAKELEIKQFEAQTDRFQAMKPEPEPPSSNAAVN